MRIFSRNKPGPSWPAAALTLGACLAGTAYAQKNVLQPSDAIIASSANSPGSEGVANAIDGTPAKYLNRDLANDAKPAGFVVTPGVGVTWVTGIAMESANDAADRDPQSITIEGSNDLIADYTTGTWELIYSNTNVPAWTVLFPGNDRQQWQTFFFDNFKSYKHYRWTVLHTQGISGVPSTCCLQIAEVQLLGTLLPKNVLQPSDGIIASSANSPGSEGVANAIDGTPAKYLNRDLANDTKPAGFIVTPSAGATLIQGISMESANDAADRDPQSITIEGSNDDIADYTTGTWVQIYSNTNIPAWTVLFPGNDRQQFQTFLFNNYQPYKRYRWTVLHTQGISGVPSTCCMQIAEVQLLGYPAPKNVVQPSDQIFASSANSPGSEGVANAIDGTPAKYLNRDLANDAKPAGFAVTPSVGATTIIGIGMESANDATDRDPKSITIEGSNDAIITDFSSGNWELVYTNDNIPSWTSLFPGNDRQQWQYFYFANKKSYTHYRWTVLHTQGINGVPTTCCMQIAEVQFLAVTTQNDCSKAAFLEQPTDTPVLPGAQPTFFTTVNGPYTLQWTTNGVPVPGAAASSFTGPPVTAANSNIVYAVQIVGCQTSTPVHAVIFAPSTTASIGIHFMTDPVNNRNGSSDIFMTSNDIAGVQLQAYWINATNASGSTGDGVALPASLNDNSNNASTITFEYTTSARWGSGVGTAKPVERMLDGTVGRANPGVDQTMTFHNVPAGSHSLLVYAVAPPAHFQTISYAVVGAAVSPTNYMRVLNSDEYKPAPGFYRATSTNASNPSIADFLRFDNVQPDPNGDITLVFQILATSDQAVGVSALQLVLNALPAGSPPAITQDPQPTVGPAGGTITLTVQATGSNLTYQWRKSGRNLPNGGHVSGATTATLTISSLSTDDEAVYNVAVFNPAGSVVSKNAVVNISKYNIQDALVGYWKLDETSGTNAASSAAGGVAGAVNGTVAWAAGKIANSLTLDGGSTYVVVPSFTAAKKQISASAWVNVAFNPGGDVAVFRNAAGGIGVGVLQNGFPASQFEIGLTPDANGDLTPTAAIAAGPNIIRATASATNALGSWQHIAFTADGAQLRLYLNGAEVASRVYLSDVIVPEVKFLSMGARLVTDTNQVPPIFPDAGLPNFLPGSLDDVALWTRALTADEVSKVYAAGQRGQPLSSVVESPPAPPVLTFTHAAGTITLSWDHGTLATSPVAKGPYTDTTFTSPHIEGTTNSAKYFRAHN